MVVNCKNFNTLKKIDASFGIKPTYKKLICPYCDKQHIDKLAQDVVPKEEKKK